MRLDETMAFYENPASGANGSSYLTGLTATYKLNPRVVPVFRAVFVDNHAPASGKDPSGSGFANPLLGVNYLRPLKNGWRWTGFLASTIPVGSGGGSSPDPAAAAAMGAAIPARSAMDNALFAVNYWTLIGGLGAARVTPGLTLQAEATVLQLTRARGPASQDAARTNLTLGLHAGRFFSKRISLGGELRLQRWMTDAAPVRANPRARETLTAAFGPRFHVKAGRHWIRPGLSYTRSLDDPLRGQGYGMVQVDVPISF